MLDGRVLGASQVEYKPFGKLPPKRELTGLPNGSGGVWLSTGLPNGERFDLLDACGNLWQLVGIREWLRGFQAPLGRQFMFGLSFSASRCEDCRTSARFLQNRLETQCRLLIFRV